MPLVPWCESSLTLVPGEALLHVKNKSKKEETSKNDQKRKTKKVVTKECGQKKVETRAQEVLGHQNGQMVVETRAQGLLSQNTAMRWVEKEQKRKTKMIKTNDVALVLLLLWCLPCVCSASGVLDATNDTSPTGSLANGTFFAVPCCGGSAAGACATWAVAKSTLSAAAAVLDSNASCNLGSLDGVNYGIMPPYGSLNPPKFVWVVVFLTSAFLSIWLGGLQQFLQQKHKRSFLSVDPKAFSSLGSIQKILVLTNLFGLLAMFLSLTRLITVGSVLFKSVDNSLLFTVLAKMGRLSDSCVFLMIPKSTIAFVR